MQQITLESVLDSVMLLPFEERDKLLDIVRRRQRDARHEAWRKEADETLASYRSGKLKAQTLEELMKELDEPDSDEIQ